LEYIDLMLHLGLPTYAELLVSEAAVEFGFISKATAASERVQMQLIKAAMLRSDWNQAITLIQNLFGSLSGDRTQEVHVLLGECCFRLATEQKESADTRGISGATFAKALAAFETGLSFLEVGGDSLSDDPILQLRVASIYFMQAEESGFRDVKAVEKTLQHLQRSLLIKPTAEAWSRAGICACQRARLMERRQDASPQAKTRQQFLQQALRYLQEANLLDRNRPQINAWLAICAVEVGKVQVAKQSFRNVLRFADRLDSGTLLELARVFLRFSDEHGPGVLQEERGMLVKDERYIQEAISAANLLLAREQHGEAHHILAEVNVMIGNDAKAVPEFCSALGCLGTEYSCNEDRMKMVAQAARACAARLVGEPHLAAQIESAAAAAEEAVRQHKQGTMATSSDATLATTEMHQTAIASS